VSIFWTVSHLLENRKGQVELHVNWGVTQNNYIRLTEIQCRPPKSKFPENPPCSLKDADAHDLHIMNSFHKLHARKWIKRLHFRYWSVRRVTSRSSLASWTGIHYNPHTVESLGRAPGISQVIKNPQSLLMLRAFELKNISDAN